MKFPARQGQPKSRQMQLHLRAAHGYIELGMFEKANANCYAAEMGRVDRARAHLKRASEIEAKFREE